MKNTKFINGLKFSMLAILTLAIFACVDDDYDLANITTPTNLSINYEIIGATAEMPEGDGSGQVRFSATADNTLTYKFVYGDGFSDVIGGGEVTHPFTTNGVNDYTVAVIAYGPGGNSTSETVTVTVFSDFNDPDTKEKLAGGLDPGSTKTWYVAASEPGHLGVGPSSGEGFDSPIYYAAAPNEKAGADVSACFYTDTLTYSIANNGDIIYNQDNNGASFYNVDFTDGAGEDQCRDLDTGGDKLASLAPGTSGIPTSTGTAINYTDGGFMSYFIGTSTYEILSITENSMYVRAIPSSNPALAWYLKFTTTPYDQQGSTGGGEEEEEPFVSQFEDLVWFDEFDGDALDTDTWNYEIGNGTNGWGNGEVQYYTEENVSVQDGSLFITAKRESESGFNFTSGRITTQDKFEFTYGRVEARAKMPEGGGTWPAIWMLGANFDEVGWPETGEIDIMEWVGNKPGETSSALHYPGNFGGDAVVGRTPIENATTEFHTYSVEWTEDNIILLLDGVEFFTFTNDASLPFNKDFFLIMNVAMGGGLGGEIADDFQESSMEVDYIRLYQ
ncbi:family 16 glycosylhydrolase [Christiangramia sediminis]|uniref:Family 16 glycosylhydrolase n=1 Tax=Christiangramia sediminis TaxID=2881336 RepID=A0A9X1LKH9_9FLAO|nr:family 16 glycosylhydrolase [Christiangramia sediminis]MCB7482048.1 family 16 glycosylhydrolase [Christiangramia sediminis]